MRNILLIALLFLVSCSDSTPKHPNVNVNDIFWLQTTGSELTHYMVLKKDTDGVFVINLDNPKKRQYLEWTDFEDEAFMSDTVKNKDTLGVR